MSSKVLAAARVPRAGETPKYPIFLVFLAFAATPPARASAAVAEPPKATPVVVEDGPAKAGEPVFADTALAPAFTDKGLLEAVEHLRNARGQAALKVLPGESKDVRVRFLRALALDAAGDRKAAAEAYDQLVPDYPVLAPRVSCLAAEAYEALQDWGAAARLLSTCARDPVLGRLAVIDRPRMLARVALGQDGLTELAPMLPAGSPKRAEALFAAADIKHLMGDDAGALELYRVLFVEEPTSPLADKGRAIARDLVRKLKAKPIREAMLIDRAERLLTANQIRGAQSTLMDVAPTLVCAAGECASPRCQEATTMPEQSSARVVADGAPIVVATATDDEAATDVLPTPPCLIETVEAPAKPDVCRAQVMRAWVARKTKANTKAYELASQVYARCSEPDTRARALFLMQGAAAALKDPDAYLLGLVMGRQFPQHTWTDDALFASAVMAKDLRQGKAERLALRLLVRTQPESDQRGEALFRLFWSHRAAGRPDRGLAALRLLEAEYDAGPRGDGGDSERGRYWWGRAVTQGGATAADKQAGIDALTRLARDRPLTYYGLLARSTLSSLSPAQDVPPRPFEAFTGPLRLSSLEGDAAWTQALELWRLGFTKEAHDLLFVIDFKPLRRDGRRGREATLLVGQLIERLGDDRGAHTIIRRELLKYVREASDPLAERASHLAFPLAFRTMVVESATTAGFNANFLQGLMREESALDPNAKSPVGARGLTQVMPATGKQVARSIGLKKFSPNELWDPQTNLRIGGVYLGSLLKTFGHPGLAAAAYNAGPGAVTRWLANTPPSSFDAFVEEIPFSETRGYVKRVLRSYAAYEHLYAEPGSAAMRVSLALRETLSGR